MNGRRGYIAGPMRGYPSLNFPAFDKARDKALELGYSPISPADIDRESGIQETADTTVFDAGEIREFVRRDTDALLSLRAERGDFIAMLPGWHKSKGATAEYHIAVWLGLRVLDAETFDPLRVEFDKPTQIVQRPMMDTGVCVGGFCDI